MRGRMAGVDLARGLAVFGMFAAHVGPHPSEGGPVGVLMELVRGRSSALFALLAGLSLVLVSGRVPKAGREWHRVRARIVIRALVLLVLGSVVTVIGTPVVVILAFYGAYFLLALPFARLGAAALAGLAVAFALSGPQLSYALRSVLDDKPWGYRLCTLDPVCRLGGDGLLGLLLSGPYPALTWMPFVFAGMALGRLDLASLAVRIRLAVSGCALALVGYGIPWLVFMLFPAVPGALADAADGSEWGSVDSPWSTAFETGTVSTGTPAGLLVAAPHSGTTFEIVGNFGVAVIVLVGSLACVEALPTLLRPVAAVGAMSLTAYVSHIAGIWALGVEDLPGLPLRVWLGFIAIIMAFAFVWTRYFHRGPLEGVLHYVTLLAGRTRGISAVESPPRRFRAR